MGIGDKISNTAEELGGKIERAVGDLTHNEELEAKGAAKEAAAKAKQAGEQVKDAAKGVVDDVKDAVNDATK